MPEFVACALASGSVVPDRQKDNSRPDTKTKLALLETVPVQVKRLSAHTNRKKVVFFGDSVTYGGAPVEDGKIFVARIDDRLAGNGFQALNAGVNNYGPKNIENCFYRLKRNIDFDHVVLIIPSVDFSRGFNKSPAAVNLFREYGSRSQYMFSVLVQSISRKFREPTNTSRGLANANNGSDRRSRQNILMENADAYGRIVQESDNVLIFIVPSRKEVESGTSTKGKEDFVKRLHEYTAPSNVVDLYAELQNDGVDIFRDNLHLNTRGHGKIAEHIWLVIDERWMRESESEL